MSEEKQIATIDEAPRAVQTAYSGSAVAFETAQRQARALSESDFVPQAFKGKIANCLVALEIAQRSRTSPLAVMQNLNVIHGKPSWSAQYIIAAVNSCGRFTAMRFEFSDQGQTKIGTAQVKNLCCRAVAIEKLTGERVEGPIVSIDTAVKEGWYTKAGSKWPAMPELMLQYRAGTFFGRLYAPEILLGMQSADEVRDVGPEQTENEARARGVADRIKARAAKVPDVEVEAKE